MRSPGLILNFKVWSSTNIRRDGEYWVLHANLLDPTLELGVGTPSPLGLGVGTPSPPGLGVGTPSPSGLGVGTPSPLGLGVGTPSPLGLGVGTPFAAGVGSRDSLAKWWVQVLTLRSLHYRAATFYSVRSVMYSFHKMLLMAISKMEYQPNKEFISQLSIYSTFIWCYVVHETVF